MRKPTPTSDSTRSKTPRTHYLNIHGPPAGTPAETAGHSSGGTYPYPGASPGSSNAQLPGVSQGGSYAYSPGPRQSVSLNASSTPLGRPQSLSQQGPQRDLMGSTSSRGYLRYDHVGRADPDRDLVTQANMIANAYSPSATSRQLPGY